MNASQIARVCDQHLINLWRVGAGNPVLDAGWLEQWWVDDCATEPASPPAGVSVLAAGGAGIRWRETDQELIGHVPSRVTGCYRVPRAAADALVRPIAA